MKRFIVSALLVCGLYIAAAAQGTSVLEQLCAKMTECTSVINYGYTLTVSGVKNIGEGTLTVQDKSYVMNGNGLKILCTHCIAIILLTDIDVYSVVVCLS